jgi:hypothetical protein
MNDNEIYEQYKTVWPEKDETNLREYVYYQRIIHDNKNQKKNLVRETVEIDPEGSEGDGNDDETKEDKKKKKKEKRKAK